MATKYVSFEVYERGELTVIGFGGKRSLEGVDVGQCRDDLAALIRETGCKTLAVDLSHVRHVPSGMLGLFASVRKLNVEVMIFNPSEDIREVLEITRLDTVMQIHTVPL